jgi:hypothetical protein
MRLVCRFAVVGMTAVPWTVPEIGTGTAKSGKPFRFTTRRRKCQQARGTPDLVTWQGLVRAEAERAMAGLAPCIGPVRLAALFVTRTPPGSRHGECWFAGMIPRDGKWVKGGVTEPDLTNLVKAAEDAIEGTAYVNDYQVREHAISAAYGPEPGLWIVVSELEPADCPGWGDPVPEPPAKARRRAGRKKVT